MQRSLSRAGSGLSRAGSGLSRSSSTNSLSSNWNNNVAEQLHRREVERRMQLHVVNRASIILRASQAIEKYLQTTAIPYVVIGGKAAAAHLAGVHMPTENRMLVQSTNDWDVMVSPQHAKRLVSDVAAVIRGIVPPNMLMSEEHELPTGLVYLLGLSSRGFLESLVDVHVKAVLPPFVTINGIRYAHSTWLLNQIQKYPGSADSPLKAVKRMKRQHYLRRV